MEWYFIVLICLGVVLLLGGIIFLIIYNVSLKNKKKINKEAKAYYQVVIDAVGGLGNIIDVTVNSSRLSFVLKNYELVKKEKLGGVGIVKSANKITLVIGSMASYYCLQIKESLGK